MITILGSSLTDKNVDFSWILNMALGYELDFCIFNKCFDGRIINTGRVNN